MRSEVQLGLACKNSKSVCVFALEIHGHHYGFIPREMSHYRWVIAEMMLGLYDLIPREV